MTKIILGIDIGACGALAVLSDGEHLHQKRCRWMRFWKIPWVAGSEFYKLMRSAEMKGIATNDTLRDHFTDLAYSYITAFQGKLTPNDLMTFARRGGTAFKNLDMDKDLGAFSVIAADVGGSKAGTALQTLQQLQLGAATMSKQQYSIYEQAGLIDPSKAHPTGFGGGKMQLDPGAIKGSLENVGHLAEWIETIIHPALMKLAHGDNNLYEALLGKAMPNRNAAGMAQMLGDPGFLDQRMKDIGLSKEALKSGAAYDTFTKDDPTGVKKKFDAQYESMMQAIGAPIMQAALPVMTAVTEFFTSVGAFANAHPDLMKVLGVGFAGISAGLLALGIALGGSALAAALGVSGWLAPAIVAVGAAAATAWVGFDHDWKGMSDAWNSNWNKAITDAFSGPTMAGAWASIKESVSGLGQWLVDAWKGNVANMKESLVPFFALFPSWEDIINGLKSAFAGLFDWLKTKINWLGSFVPGWHDISGRASDIPGMSEHLHGGGGGGDGGSPAHRAAYGGGGRGSNVGAGASLVGGGTIADQIRKYGGADAGALMAIARSEGGIGNIYDKSGDHGTSFGPFQMHFGGRGSQADILAARGINVRDPSTLQAQIAYMRQYGRIHGGWGANVWHGIHDKYHVPSIRSHPDDNAGAHRQSYAPPPRSNTTVVVHSRVNLDGRVLASGVERHIVKKHRFASGPADHDGRAGLPHVDSASNMG